MAIAARLKVRLTIPERSNVPTQVPAIGLAAAVRRKDSGNPFDLGEALARQGVAQPMRETVPVAPEQQPEAPGT